MPFLHFVQSPLGILALGESLPEVFFFLFEQLRIAAHSLGPIFLWLYNGVQEGNGTILLVVLHCKFYGRVNTVNMLEQDLFIDFLVDNKGVIHKPAPEPWGGMQCLGLLL